MGIIIIILATGHSVLDITTHKQPVSSIGRESAALTRSSVHHLPFFGERPALS